MDFIDKDVGLEEKVFPTVFFMYKFTGFWPPLRWSAGVKVIYHCYTAFVFFLMSTVNITEVLYVAFNWKSFEQILSDDACLVLTKINVVFRISIVLMKRNHIAPLLQGCIQDRWYKTRDEEELDNRVKYHRLARWTTLTYASMTGGCCLVLWLRKNMDDETNKTEMKLPMNAWYPYDIEVPMNFWITYMHQTFGCLAIVSGHTATACLIIGFMMQTCSQLKVLRHRILKMPEIVLNTYNAEETKLSLNSIEKKYIVDCIRDYKSILSFAKDLNNTFTWVQFLQFFVSMVVTCTTIYQLSKQNVATFGFFMVVFFLACMLLEMYMFCWYGNEIILDSLSAADAIYDMDWTNLRISSRKLLIIMLMGMSKPIQMTGGPIVVWDLDSFIAILKTSYSIFNFLQRRSA